MPKTVMKCGLPMQHYDLEETSYKIEQLVYVKNGVTLKMNLLDNDNIKYITNIFIYTNSIHINCNEFNEIHYPDVTRSVLVDYLYRFRDGLVDLANLDIKTFRSCLPSKENETELNVMGASHTTGVDVFAKRLAVSFYLASEEIVCSVALDHDGPYNKESQVVQFKSAVAANVTPISTFLHELEAKTTL